MERLGAKVSQLQLIPACGSLLGCCAESLPLAFVYSYRPYWSAAI